MYHRNCCICIFPFSFSNQSRLSSNFSTLTFRFQKEVRVKVEFFKSNTHFPSALWMKLYFPQGIIHSQLSLSCDLNGTVPSCSNHRKAPGSVLSNRHVPPFAPQFKNGHITQVSAIRDSPEILPGTTWRKCGFWLFVLCCFSTVPESSVDLYLKPQGVKHGKTLVGTRTVKRNAESRD